MLIQASNLIKLPVAAIDAQSKIGEVARIIINPENGEVLGFLVTIDEGWLGKKYKVLSANDVIAVEKTGIVTKNADNLVEPDEIVRAKKILDKKIYVIGQRAMTKSQKNLGRVEDLLLNSETLEVLKYYIHGIFQEKIIPASKIAEITAKAVIFSDDVIEEAPLAEPEGAAA